MILTLRNKYIYWLLVLLLGGALVAPRSAIAQESLALSVTPTLFELSAVPDQTWKSSIKVINSNSYPITVYANPVNFQPQGEIGHGKFLPVFDTAQEGATLAEWISVTSEEIEIPAETSAEVSFVVEVPANAAPGGHFAAILVGTQPPSFGENKLQVRTSQIVSSLFFLRIEGDVVEDGTIRSFVTTSSFSEEPTASFELRFENKGNVHLQPRGSIEIYNMWGKERGLIPINQQTNFGNVLPESIRKFSFSWTGESSFSDIGRYKAVVSLAYGSDGRQFVSRTTHFWVIPIKAGLVTIIFLITLVLFVRWTIKLYVRHVLAQAGLTTQYQGRRRVVPTSEEDVDLTLRATQTSSVRTGYISAVKKIVSKHWQIALSRLDTLCEKKLPIVISTHYKFGLLIVIGVVLLLIMVWFIVDARGERNFSVSIETESTPVQLNSEELQLEKLLDGAVIIETPQQQYAIDVINTSGTPGVAATVAVELLKSGYSVEAVSAEDERVDQRSVIVFSTGLQEEALELSALLQGALLSADSTSSSSIRVYAAIDQISN